MSGEGFFNLPDDFVVAMDRSYARNRDIGNGVYQCHVIDNNHAVVYCPSHTYNADRTFDTFAVPLTPTRRIVDVTFR